MTPLFSFVFNIHALLPILAFLGSVELGSVVSRCCEWFLWAWGLVLCLLQFSWLGSAGRCGAWDTNDNQPLLLTPP